MTMSVLDLLLKPGQQKNSNDDNAVHFALRCISPKIIPVSFVIVYLMCGIIAGSFKSQLIDYFRGHIVSWEKPLQFYAN